jgi:hypothetical protein
MRRICAACLALALATPIGAEEIDPVGTWACTYAKYDSGADLSKPVENVFNLAIYRSGRWAAAGRYPNGSPYQGEGTWRFARVPGGGLAIAVEGRTKTSTGIPEPFSFEADIEGPDEFSRVSKRYRTTTAVECVRREG